MKSADAKLQRWIDLIAALLQHRFGATFAELKTLVPAFGGEKEAATVARMFERDKDELRALGIPIRVRDEDTEDGQTQRYFIKPGEMYLPYLALAARPAASRTVVPPEGYRTVPTLAFEPDELSVLIRAAGRTKTTGDPALAHDAESAIRKLTHDLGLALGSIAGESESDGARTPEASIAPKVSVLGEALLRRKRVTFTYRSMSRDIVDERTVESYGLSFSSGHWYLSGRDVAIDGIRKFRVSRVEDLTVNAKRPQSHDYEIPADFKLADHAKTRGPWELGEEPSEEMVVEIRSDTGAARALQSLGSDVHGHPMRRRFHVRRLNSFVRWLMSFAGDVVPISPPALVDQYHATISATLARYVANGAEVQA